MSLPKSSGHQWVISSIVEADICSAADPSTYFSSLTYANLTEVLP